MYPASSNIFKIIGACIFSPTSLLLGIYPTDMLTRVQSDLFARFVIAALFVIAKDCMHPKCLSTGGQEQIMVHLDHGILCSHKK